MAVSLLTLLAILQHPLIQAIQIQASLVLLVGIIGWSVAGYRRGREAHRLTAAGYAAALQQIQTLKQTASGSTTPCHSSALPSGSADGTVAVQLGKQTADNAGTPGTQGCCEWPSTHGACSKQSSSNNDSAHQQDWGTTSGLRHRGHVVEEQQQQKEQLYCCAAACNGCPVTTAAAPAAVPGSSIFKSHTGQTAGLAAGWPGVAVVCPVKGCRQHSRDNWETQLAAQYGGPRVFVFVVESDHDAAVAALREMLEQQQHWQQQPQKQQQQQQSRQWLPCHAVALTPSSKHARYPEDAVQQQRDLEELHDQQQQQQQWQQQYCVLDAWHAGPDQQLLLVNAGLATTCSQKIHNILAGIDVSLTLLQQQQQQHQANMPGTAAGSGGITEGYVCVLDDDVSLHPLSLMQLVDELEADQTLFMATGYPFDVVSVPHSSSSSSFCGRLCAHATAAYHLPLCIGFSVADRGGFVWGGVMLMRAEYLSTAAAELAAAESAPANKHVSTRPGSPLADAAGGEPPIDRSNILQVWRHGGYSDDLLLSGFCAAHQLSIAVPVSAYFPQLLPPMCTFKQYWNYLRRQLFVLDTYYSTPNKRINHTMMVLHSYGSAVFTGATVATALQLVLLVVAAAGALLAGTDISTVSSMTTSATRLFTACTVLSLLSICYMTRQVRRLFCVLSPDACKELQQYRVSVIMLWLGWTLENLILPYCTLYCCLCDHIVWGGITYHKKNGKVDTIVHPKQAS